MPATLRNVRKTYGERARVMSESLKRELGDAIEFTQPQGGLFFWARLTGAGGKVKDAGEFAKGHRAGGCVRAGGAVLC
jgi:2-aminoadipate transaminase